MASRGSLANRGHGHTDCYSATISLMIQKTCIGHKEPRQWHRKGRWGHEGGGIGAEAWRDPCRCVWSRGVGVAFREEKRAGIKAQSIRAPQGQSSGVQEFRTGVGGWVRQEGGGEGGRVWEWGPRARRGDTGTTGHFSSPDAGRQAQRGLARDIWGAVEGHGRLCCQTGHRSTPALPPPHWLSLGKPPPSQNLLLICEMEMTLLSGQVRMELTERIKALAQGEQLRKCQVLEFIRIGLREWPPGLLGAGPGRGEKVLREVGRGCLELGSKLGGGAWSRWSVRPLPSQTSWARWQVGLARSLAHSRCSVNARMNS